jgi:hypothetical protein
MALIELPREMVRISQNCNNIDDEEDEKDLVGYDAFDTVPC